MVKVIINRSLDGKFQKITEDLEEYGQIYANKVATQLVLASPVDTGTFMDNFFAGSSGTAGTTSSRGKPRNQPWNGQEAINRMSSGISALKGSTVMNFGNSADHAFEVEYDHGYAPFGKVANMHGQLMREAWAEAGL
jgi:hypothetical protein